MLKNFIFLIFISHLLTNDSVYAAIDSIPSNDQWLSGTKQLYQTLDNSFPHFLPFEFVDLPDGCNINQIIQVSRHGARFPTPRKYSVVKDALIELCGDKQNVDSSDDFEWCSYLLTEMQENDPGR